MSQSGVECKITSSIVIVNGHSYLLKYNSRSSDILHPAIIYYVRNISTNPTAQNQVQLYREISGVPTYNIFQHPNSLTHYNAKFYMADLHTAIYRFSISGEIDMEYSLDSSMTDSGFTLSNIYSIEHYSDSLFFLSGKVNNTRNRRKYWIVQLSNGIIIKKGTFYCSGCAMSG